MIHIGALKNIDHRSEHIMSMLEKALLYDKSYGKDDVEIFPFNGNTKGMHQMEYFEYSLDYIRERVSKEDKVIFLCPKLATFCMLNSDIDYEYEVFGSNPLTYLHYNEVSHSYLYNCIASFENLITSSYYTALTYNRIDARIVGGFIDDPEILDHTKVPKTVYWSTHEIKDSKSNVQQFIDICRRFPEYIFVVISSQNFPEDLDVPDNVDHHTYMNDEDYKKSVSRCEYVLSTKYCESFSYSLMGAVNLGCIPLVPDLPCYQEFFPRKFRYNIFSSFILADEGELLDIVSPHHYLKTYKRLVTDETL